MTSAPLTAESLWQIPRVGAPLPLPDGAACIVPVTTHDAVADKGTTRLWYVPAGDVATSAVVEGDDRPRALLGSATPRPLTAEDASSTAPSLSRDGQHLAFLRKPGGDPAKEGAAGPLHPDERQLYVLPLEGGEAERVTDLPLGVAGARWLPDGRLVLAAAVYRDARTPTAAAARKAALADDPVTALVSEDRVVRFWDHWLTEGSVHHLFVLDPATGDLHDLMPGSTRWLPWMDPGNAFDVAPDGEEVAFAACRSESPHTQLLWGVFTLPIPPRGAPAPGEDDDPAVLISADDDASTGARPIYAPYGRSLIYGLRREHDFYADRTRLVSHDRATGADTVLTESWDSSAAGWTFDPADARTLHLLAESDGRTARFTLDLDAARRDPDAHPPAEQERGASFAGLQIAGGRAFFTRHALDAPPEIYVATANVRGPRGAEATRLTHFTADALEGIALGAVREMRFAGHGGDEVQAFLVWPPGVQPPADHQSAATIDPDHAELAPTATVEPLPLVHMIHGGPHGAFGDGWHWRWSSQVFAAPGRLCALVNFHGSTGFGDAFTRSILGRWGDQPTADVEAATDALLARGWVDPSRMAITGGSYGGYLVSWLCTQTSRYTCAVNHAGVCDFQTQFASDLTQGRPRSFGGELWDNLDGLDRWNPLRHAEDLRTPMLVLHGQKDYRVPYAQGLQIYATYKARGLPARLVIYPDENHWILKRANSLHWYGEVLGWLARWLDAEAVG